MRRTVGLLITFTLGLLTAALPADAQLSARIPRIGILWFGGPAEASPFQEAFRQGLRDLGYIEGQNVSIESRFAEFRFDRLPGLVADLISLKADIILASSTPPARAAKEATTTIPIVFASVVDPVRSKLVTSLARPGGNITGLSTLSTTLSKKKVELLKEIVPKASRIAVLWNPGDPDQVPAFQGIEVAVRALSMQLQSLEVRGPNELDSAFAAMNRGRAGAVMVEFGSGVSYWRKQIVDLATKSRLPAMYTWREYAEVGGLMAFGPSILTNFRRAAVYVDKILKGAKPADLPVEQPTKFELTINLKTAKALGLTIPQSVLIRADEVIQ